MQVNRPHLRRFTWILLIHGNLGKVPGAVYVVGAKLKRDSLAIRRARLQAISGYLATDLIACD